MTSRPKKTTVAKPGSILPDSVVRSLLSASPTREGSAKDRIRALAESAPVSLDEWCSRVYGDTGGSVDVIDFFSGCGGMSAGFKAVNGIASVFRHIMAVDVDQAANDSYELNLGLRPLRLDVHDLVRDPSRLDEAVAASARQSENPLVLIGCAPCQGFSSHRNKDGHSDSRNELFEGFALLAVRLAPDFVVIENVPELCTDQHWPRVQRVRSLLEENGYYVHLAVHNLAEFGLPQQRFRAVMIASRKSFEPPSGFVPHERFRTVRDSIGGLPPVLAGAVCSTDPLHQSASHRASTLEMIKSVPKDGGNRLPGTGPVSLQTLQARQGKAAYEDVYGRLHWDRPSITITHYARNPASGRFVHPEQDRGLTTREAALLQGFPAGYRFAGGFDDRFRQIGNAVPPVIAAHLALHLLGEMLDPFDGEFDPGLTAPLARSVARLIPALKARAARNAGPGRSSVA